MTTRAKEIFRTMNDGELLSTASFFQVDYTPETLAVLREEATSRGITDDRIRQYRRDCYADLGLEFECDFCGSRLTLEEDEFIGGSYACPDCDRTSPVNYMELSLPEGVGENLARIAILAAGSIAGALALSVRDNRKQAERRQHILDGTYWKALQEIAASKSPE